MFGTENGRRFRAVPPTRSPSSSRDDPLPNTSSATSFVLRGVDMPEYDHAMFGSRDAKLVAAVDAIVAGQPVARRAAVVFGASHMRVVSRRVVGDDD